MSAVATPAGRLPRRTARTGPLAFVLGKERGVPGAKVAFRLMLSVFCLVAGVIYLIPLVWVLSLSVRSSTDVFNASLWPHEWIFGNYVTAWNQYGLGLLFVHSLIVTGVTTIVTIVLSVTAAYGLAGARSRGAYLTMGLLLAGLMVPAAVIIVPFFLLAHQIGLYNSLFGVVLAEIAFALPLAVIILRGYVETIPKGLIDSARVDGASEFVAFRRIALPLLKPAIATVAIFTIISTWNDFLLPLVMMNNTGTSTLTVGMSQFAGAFGSLSWQLTGAASTMAMIPLILVFFIGRRYYVRGLTAGALRE